MVVLEDCVLDLLRRSPEMIAMFLLGLLLGALIGAALATARG